MNKYLFSLESVKRVESILSQNPGNYERKKPITFGKNEMDTLTSIQRDSYVEEEKLEV